MSLAKISIERPVFAWMLMSALILFGIISFRNMGVSQLPDVDFPTVNVSVTLDGASPEVMESDVVDVLENSFMGITGLKNVTSSSRFGGASISLEFDLDRDIDFAMQEVQSKISQSVRLLPTDIDPPVVSKNNPEDQPIIWVGLSGSFTQRELMAFARDKIINQFQLVPGVGDVTLGGFVTPNMRVWVDAKKLMQYELSIDDVIAAIGSEHVELPAGSFTGGTKEFNLRVKGEVTSPEDMGKIFISKRGGAINYNPVRLSQVAKVEAGLEDNKKSARVLGETAVGIGVRKQRGTNAVQVAQAVKAKMAELNPTLPEGLKLGVNFDSTRFIEESVSHLEFELLLSVLLTALVCFVFLGSWSSTWNILLAIPTSLIGSLTILYFMGFTLNTFTLLGLTLAVGIVVDDAIMVLENIVRYREMGKPKRVAALEGTNQISFAALATTLAIIAIFLPVAFMKGVIGKFFLQFGITISIAVAISLLEALTLTPMRCSQFLYVPEHGESRWGDRVVNFLTQAYSKTLDIALAHKWKTILGAVAIFASSALLVKGMRKEFVPPQDQGLFMVRLQMPVGTSLDATDLAFQKAEETLKNIPEIKRFFSSIGGFGMNSLNSGIIFVTLTDLKERTRSQFDVMAQARKELNQIPQAKAIIQDLSARGFGQGRSFPIEFSLRGPDWQKLVELSQDIEKKLKADSRFTDVDSNFEEGSPEIQIVPDRDKALALGVSIEDIGRVIRLLVGGGDVTRYTENGRRIEVRVRLQEVFRGDKQDILNLFVRNNRGELIKLSDVVTLEEKTTLVSITREQRERSISMYTNVALGASQADMMKSIEDMGKTLPSGYTMVTGGSSKAFAESFAGLTFALWFGVLVAYMILASQFNSFIHPITVLLSLPFSLTGAWLALRISDQSLNIYSFIGFILLMGIVKKNSIMLVDFANQLRAEGEGALAAMRKAAPVRLRPILMTSIAIVAAALPSAMGIGAGSETRIPMSMSVIGGVLVSTLFTLYVVPVAYVLFSKLERKK